MENRNARDSSISFVRGVSMVFIVLCHFLQYYGNMLDAWFNVGVQMFLFMSGYLYANRNIVDDIAFIKKNFIKILVPYYIFVVFVVLVKFLFLGQCGVMDVIKLVCLFGSGKIQGLANLWFVPVILLCYIMTPLFLKWMKYIENKQTVMGLCLTILGLMIYFQVFNSYYTSAWMVCYFGGIIIGRLLENNEGFFVGSIKRGSRILKEVICIAALFTNGIQILLSRMQKVNLENFNYIWNIYCNYSHVLLGISLFFIIRDVYRCINKQKDCSKILKTSDKYSYCVYLVHQIFILGEFSVLDRFSANPVLGIGIVLLLTCFSAKILYEVSERVKNSLRG